MSIPTNIKNLPLYNSLPMCCTTTDVQDDEYVVISADKNEATLNEIEIGNLFQNTSSDEEFGKE